MDGLVDGKQDFGAGAVQTAGMTSEGGKGRGKGSRGRGAVRTGLNEVWIMKERLLRHQIMDGRASSSLSNIELGTSHLVQYLCKLSDAEHRTRQPASNLRWILAHGFLDCADGTNSTYRRCLIRELESVRGEALAQNSSSDWFNLLSRAMVEFSTCPQVWSALVSSMILIRESPGTTNVVTVLKLS
ncbi:hypothetical protein LIA77_03207 [Sarocladium implicatum]|nr:hypothetical protein LIA77_03207 [Sarocladium implicatum]